MSESAIWDEVAQRARGGLEPPNRRVRASGVALAILAHLLLILLLLQHAKLDAPRRGGGIRILQLWPLAGVAPGTIHPNARKTPPRPAPTVPKPRPPEPNTPNPELPVPAPPLPPQVPEEPKKPEPTEVEPPPMTQREIDEFKRQWAQMQGEITKQALDEAQRHGLKQDLSDLRRPQKFGPVDDDRTQEAARHAPAESDSMFAGELCVSRAGADNERALALPCIGDGYVTDFGWVGRVHAPVRGDPLTARLEPGGHVIVRNHEFSAETVAAFNEAQAQLGRIQVTLRMVYVPELRAPLQLLSRDDRAHAIAAQAFSSEHELALYLREWAGNVERWMAFEHPQARPAAAPAAVER